MDKYKTSFKYNNFCNRNFFRPKLLTVLLTAFYTRIMGSGDFGGATSIQNAVNILVRIVTLARKFSCFKIFNRANLPIRKACLQQEWLTTLAGFAVFCLLSPLVSKITINDFNMGEYVTVLYLMLLGSSLRQLCQQFVRGMGNVKLYAMERSYSNGNLCRLYIQLYLGVCSNGE